MNEERFVVSDMLWRRFEPHFLGKIIDAGATAKDNRLFFVASAHRVAMARPPTCFWPLEQPVPAVSKMGESGHFQDSFQRHE